MMVINNKSTNQVVMYMYINGTVVYDQPRLLPFRLRKDYQEQLHVLKKYVTAVKRKQSNILPQILSQLQETLDSVVSEKNNIENAEEQDETIEAVNILNNEDLNILEVINDGEREDNKESNIQAQIKTPQNFIKSGKEKQKENRDKVQTKIFLTLSIPGYFCLIMPQGGNPHRVNPDTKMLLT